MHVRPARWLALLALLAAFTPLLPSVAHATIARAMAMRELVTEADVIARVTVLDRQARYDALDRIVTDVRVRVDEPLFGATEAGVVRAGDELVITRLGGELDGLGLRIEGEPTFPVGEELLLFAVDLGGELHALGMSQGVFPIARDGSGHELVAPNGGGLSLVAPGGGDLVPAVPALPVARPVDAFLDEVRTLIAEVRHEN